MAHKHSAPMYSFAGAHHRGNKTYINNTNLAQEELQLSRAINVGPGAYD